MNNKPLQKADFPARSLSEDIAAIEDRGHEAFAETAQFLSNGVVDFLASVGGFDELKLKFSRTRQVNGEASQ